MHRTLCRTSSRTLLAITLLSPAMMDAQIDRSKAPEPGPAPEVRLGDHATFVLGNGMRVILVENHKLPLVSVQVKFDIPIFLQGPMAGLTDMTGELLAAGAGRRTKQQIDALVDGIGGKLSTSSDGVYASCLTKDLDTLMTVVSDVVRRPTFAGSEIDRVKKRMISEVRSRHDDPDAIASEVGHVLTFTRGYPYGEITSEKTISNVERKEIQGYHDRFFRADKGYVVFVGDINEKHARYLAERAFGSWRDQALGTIADKDGNEVVEGLGSVRYPRKQPQPFRTRRVALVDRPDAPQSVFRVVFPVQLKPGDDIAIDAQVMNTILGGGVFNARLMQNLREDKGYTYGAYSSLNSDRYCGSFSAGASVRTPVTDSAITEAMFEIERMTLTGVSKEELQLAKNYMAGSFARSLEDPRTIARFALNTYLNNLPEDFYSHYLERLDTVTVSGVLHAARALLVPDQATILVVGDKEVLYNRLSQLSFDQRVFQFDEDGDIHRDKLDPIPADVTAKTVVDGYIKALGGEEAVRKVKSVKMVMTGTQDGKLVTITMVHVEPDKFAYRRDVDGRSQEKVVLDGQRARRTTPEGSGEIIEMELEDLVQSAPPFPEIHYEERHIHPVLSGVVDINGRRAYKLIVPLDNGEQYTDYFDVESGLKIRHEERRTYGPRGMVLVTDYQDQRPESGVLFPHLIVEHQLMEQPYVVSQIEVNGRVDPSEFALE
ncbi:MAG: insulinase family protein [Flavobacteriales bacterium]|nr:insulinase family protein [Flavobacteriales bacterium]